MFNAKFNYDINKIEGIYQIKIDIPWAVKFVSLYLFELDELNILIDSGLNIGTWQKKLFSALKDINFTIQDIDYCIITHMHTDHIGNCLNLKQKNPELKLLMHDITHELLKWETNDENLKELKQEAREIANQLKKYGISEEQGNRIVQFFTYWPRFLQYQYPDIIVHDGDTVLDRLEIIWTPGHSFGHICVFDKKEKYLFSGDHILSRITPHIGNFVVPEYLAEEYKGYDFDNILKHYLASLDKIDKLNPKIIFPAHQEIIFNPHERILQIKEHHKNRLAEISSVIKDNPLTAYRISQIHFGEDLDEMNSYMALSEVLGHLLYLEAQEKVKTIEKNGKLLYYC
ncbi:MAG: MBL fold metallo-hydrolase [Promethearchaeota archaeon]|nr:MAG: MBL fold metallo-hydrolase [Candidatus Lokiarchaeota archaeon]